MYNFKRSVGFISFISLLLTHILPVSAFAASERFKIGLSPLPTQELTSGVSEYYFSSSKEDVLVPVYLMGSVSKPGLYHVPIKSDLITVLSVAGGISPEADPNAIQVKNSVNGKTDQFKLSDLVSEKTKGFGPQFQGSEIVYVEKSQPAVSNNTMLILGLVSGLASLALTGYIFSKK